MSTENGKQKRGFATMDPELRRQIASKGGRAAHERGTAHVFDADEARAAGKKGGTIVSQNREHMVEIGRRGGKAVSRDPAFMSEIGKPGGAARRRASKLATHEADSLEDT